MSWMKHSIRFFDTRFMDSILKEEVPSASIHEHSAFLKDLQETSNKESSAKKPPLPPSSQQARTMFSNFNELNLEQLVLAFMTKDSNKDSSQHNYSNITAPLDITMPSFHTFDESEKFMKAMIQQ